MRRRLVNALPAIVLVAVLLGAWELYVDSGATNSSILPAPHTIAESLWGNAGLLSHNLAVTAEEVALGLLLALALGFALGVLIHLSPPLRRAMYPLTVGSQAVPIAVIALEDSRIESRSRCRGRISVNLRKPHRHGFTKFAPLVSRIAALQAIFEFFRPSKRFDVSVETCDYVLDVRRVAELLFNELSGVPIFFTFRHPSSQFGSHR